MRSTSTKILLKPEFCVGLSLLFLLLPLRWIIAWIVAALVHELFHYFALRICGKNVLSVTVGFHGTTMETEPLERGKEIICALCGPVGGLLPLLFARVFPEAAICAFFQSLYNLIPVYPLDGGRALRCAMPMFLPQHIAAKAYGVVEIAVIGVLMLAGIIFLKFKLGPLPFLVGCSVLVQSKRIKFPCKPKRQKVQ